MADYSLEDLEAEAQRRGLIKTAPKEQPSTVARVATAAAPYVGGFAQGAAEALNPAAIPRGIETLGRAVFSESGGPIERLTKAEEHSVIPAPTIGEQAAAIRSLPSLFESRTSTFGGDFLNNFENEKSAQKEYEGGLKGQTIGQIVAIAPSLVSLAKSGARVVTKTISKVPGLIGAIENFVTKAGIRAGTGERIVQQGVANAEKLKQFKTVGDTYLYDKAQELGKVVENYRDFRNANYEKAIEPILESKGKIKIPIEEVKKAVFEGLGEAKTLSGRLVKYLTNLSDDIRDKEVIDFSKANEIKKQIMNLFGGFRKASYVGRTPDDALAARNVGFKLIDAINDKIPEIAPINNDYRNASNLLEDLEGIIGPKSRSGMFKKAQAGISTSMSKGKEALAVILDNLKGQFPESKNVIDDFRNFIAAKAIQGGAQPGLSAIATNRGLYGRASGILQFIKDQPFERGIDLITAIRSASPITQPQDVAGLLSIIGSKKNRAATKENK
jgi:hypothetical protein